MTTILYLDFETAFDRDYSLTRMTSTQYINDDRFELLGAGVAVNEEPSHWVDGPDVPSYLAKFDLADTVIVNHNSPFDASILAWHYDVRPLAWIDTMAMAQASTYHETGSVALGALAEHFGFPLKGDALRRTMGRSFAEIKSLPDIYAELAVYACNDVDIMRMLFHRLVADGFPPGQIPIIDMNVRMMTQPQFVLDPPRLERHLAATIARKETLIAQSGFDSKALGSADKLAAILESFGIEPPRKISPTTGELTWAFAKTDKEFTDLLYHENPDVQAVVAARLGVKSTLEETRTKRLIAIADVNWPNGYPPHAMPIPLRYSGAHTHRYSGMDAINMQNLPKEGELRKCLIAPPGMKVVSIDLAQVEARILATLAGQEDLVEQFRAGEDVYASFASAIYNIPVDRDTDDGRPRKVGKVGILSLGYGSGAPRFQGMVRTQSNHEVEVDEDEAREIVRLYRSTYREIRSLWREGDAAIEELAAGTACEFASLPVENGTILLPSGLCLHYNDLEQVENKFTGRQTWSYRHGKRLKYLYGSALVENVVQALAFCLIMEGALRVKKRWGYQLAHQIHDEAVYVLPEDKAEQAMNEIVEEIAKPPAWLPDAPIAAEGHVGDSYGDCG